MNMQQMQSKLACQTNDVDGYFRGGFGGREMNNFFLHHHSPQAPPSQLPSFSPTSGGGGSSSSGPGGNFFKSPQMGYQMMTNPLEQGNGWSFQTPNEGVYVGNQANGVVCMKQGGGNEKGEGISQSFVVERKDETVQHTKVCSRGHWRPAEDARLKELVSQYGPQNWNQIAERLEGRSGKSCRLRWFNQLDPRINKRAFSEEEEEKLLSAHRLYGNKWAMIARLFPGRTDNAVKNHWHVIMARRDREESSTNKRRKASVPPQAMMMMEMEMEMEINPTNMHLLPNNNALSADSTISSTIDESASTVTHDHLSLNNYAHFAMFNNFSPSQHQSPLQIQMGGTSDQQKWMNGMMLNSHNFGSMGSEHQSGNVCTNLEVSATDSFGTITTARNNFCKGSGDHEKINRPFIDFLGVGSA